MEVEIKKSLLMKAVEPIMLKAFNGVVKIENGVISVDAIHTNNVSKIFRTIKDDSIVCKDGGDFFISQDDYADINKYMGDNLKITEKDGVVVISDGVRELTTFVNAVDVDIGKKPKIVDGHWVMGNGEKAPVKMVITTGDMAKAKDVISVTKEDYVEFKIKEDNPYLISGTLEAKSKKYKVGIEVEKEGARDFIVPAVLIDLISTFNGEKIKIYTVDNPEAPLVMYDYKEHIEGGYIETVYVMSVWKNG